MARYADGRHGGLALGANGLFRHGVLVAGGFGEFVMPAPIHAAAGVQAGLAHRGHDGFRVDLLGVVGVRAYAGWNAEFIGDDPGADATLAFAGPRLRVAWIHGEGRRGHFCIGGVLGWDADLNPKTVHYTYVTRVRVYDDEEGTMRSVTEHGAQHVGGSRVLVGLSVGVVIDTDRR